MSSPVPAVIQLAVLGLHSLWINTGRMTLSLTYKVDLRWTDAEGCPNGNGWFRLVPASGTGLVLS